MQHLVAIAENFRCDHPARLPFSKPLQYLTTFETIRTMLIGYARVSTNEQTLDLQKDALENIGCTKIFSDVVSGAKAERTGLHEALEYVREGDTIVVWRLDRLGRSLKHLIETITRLNNRKIGFKSITENIDTTTSGGKLVFHIFGALAEFERDIIRERTNAGLSAARARGRLGGRPKAKTLDSPKKVALAQSLYDNKNNTIDEICKTLNVSRATLYRYINTGKKAE
jgi:DNA invertase Pin-like site-specific DNA recombinase